MIGCARGVLFWCRQPAAGWALLAVLYLMAALPGTLLALTMFAGQPLSLGVAATTAPPGTASTFTIRIP